MVVQEDLVAQEARVVQEALAVPEAIPLRLDRLPARDSQYSLWDMEFIG